MTLRQAQVLIYLLILNLAQVQLAVARRHLLGFLGNLNRVLLVNMDRAIAPMAFALPTCNFGDNMGGR